MRERFVGWAGLRRLRRRASSRELVNGVVLGVAGPRLAEAPPGDRGAQSADDGRHA
jgi:hypothetical protein